MKAQNINKFLLSVIGILLIFSFLSRPVQAENHDELLIFIGDSLMKAKDGDVQAVSKNMVAFEEEWNASKKADSKQAATVDKRLKAVKAGIDKGQLDSEGLNKLLSALSSAVVQYDEEQNPADTSKDKEKVKALLPLLNKMSETITMGDYTKAKSQYSDLLNTWTDAEKGVRSESVGSYGEIEKYMAYIRIALTQEPADQDKALVNLKELKTFIEKFLSGDVKQIEETGYSLSDVAKLLMESEKAIERNKISQANEKLNKILTIWPMVEGDVQTRDSKLYSDMETKVPTAISILQSKKTNTEKAQSMVHDLNERLSPLIEKTSYSIWDAVLILLREGLEALLIVGTLIAFLKKVNQGDKQKWIWVGVVAGLVFSAVLAVIINIVFSQFTAASSREYIEGITGIIAVIMMLTVGAWLHNKSNITSWNRYINKQMGNAIAKGSLFSFAIISFLSIFREGAETIIFYTGMAPYMSLKQLAIGITIALVILVIIGYLIIHYGVRIPISLFFTIATVLIYLLSFKILGVSVHSLQVSQIIPTHTIYPFPFIEWIGLYPTWETLLPQIALLIVIFLLTIWNKRKSKEQGIPH